MSQWIEPWEPYIWGYLFSVLGGHWAVQAVIRPLYGTKHDSRPAVEVLGYVERVLYTSSILLEVPLLIGFWLALKVAGSWKHLDNSDQTAARDLINTFLTGNVLSLMYGFVGGQTIVWWQAQGWGGHVPTVPVALVVGTVFLWSWIWWRSLRGSHESKRAGGSKPAGGPQ